MKNTYFPSAVAALALATTLAAASGTAYANDRNYDGVANSPTTTQQYVTLPQSPVASHTNARNYVSHDATALVQEQASHASVRQALHTNNRAYGSFNETPARARHQNRQSSLHDDHYRNLAAYGPTASADISDTYDQGSVENAAQVQAQTKRQAWF